MQAHAVQRLDAVRRVVSEHGHYLPVRNAAPTTLTRRSSRWRRRRAAMRSRSVRNGRWRIAGAILGSVTQRVWPVACHDHRLALTHLSPYRQPPIRQKVR